jgi:beta-glucanase (GH16 family)
MGSEPFNHFNHLAILSALLLTSCIADAPRPLLSEPPANESEAFIAYEGYTGVYPGLTLEVDDRFDKFDAVLWKKGDGAVGTESACRFQPQGVQVKDGLLELLIQQEEIAGGWSKDHEKMKTAYNYSCGELRFHDDNRIRYGRIETRMKAPARQTGSGYILSLFTYVNDHDGTANPENRNFWEEIDIELEGGRPDKFQANLIYGMNTWNWGETRDYGAWEDKIEVGPVDEWRVFAVEWRSEHIQWFVDGELVKTLKKSDVDCSSGCQPTQKYAASIPTSPAPIMMNFWIPNDTIQDVFGGNKARNRYPMKAQYDWFRYYSLDENN